MHFDVAIVGGGLAGLALASALRETRLKIALIENQAPTPAPGWDARIYAISPANADFLRTIGAWKHFDRSRIAPIDAMSIVGDGGARLDFSAYQAGIAELGWIIESSLMAEELWQSVKRQSNVELFCPARPGAIDLGESTATTATTAALTLEDGRTLHARLLVGADGRDSWVRNAAGLPAVDTPYGEMGLVANFDCEQPHQGIARQWFRDDGVLAWLPLPGNRISIVWSTPTANAQALLALPAETLAERVAAAGGMALGKLTPLTAASAFPLRLIRVPRTVGQRLALIGDAAHGIHPLSGHGINLGYQDAQTLAGLLAATPAWQDIGDPRLLRRYQRARREEILLLQSSTHTLHQLFREKLPGLKPLRNFGLTLTNALPIVKNLLVRYAIGAF